MVVEKAQGAKMEEQFVQQMKLLREVQRISQGELASRMVSAGWEFWRQTTVSRIEKFERTVRLAEAHDIAQILGLPLAGMMTASGEVQNQNIGAAERRRDMDDSVGRLNKSMASFMAELDEFRTTLNRVHALPEGLTHAVGMQAATSFEWDENDAARTTVKELTAGEDVHDDNDLTKAETRNGIHPEA